MPSGPSYVITSDLGEARSGDTQRTHDPRQIPGLVKEREELRLEALVWSAEDHPRNGKRWTDRLSKDTASP